MDLREYFEQKRGKGILSTSDSSGRVNSAVYARPHFMDDGTVAFIMAHRLTHENIMSNPHACYIFLEDGERYAGKRLYLKKIREEKNSELIDQLRRKRHYIPHEEYYKEDKYLVYFEIENVLPLIGSDKN